VYPPSQLLAYFVNGSPEAPSLTQILPCFTDPPVEVSEGSEASE
jgi:hypothetical protein